MKNTFKHTFLSALFLGFVACDTDDVYPPITDTDGTPVNTIQLDAGSTDFSNYVAVGASFTAGVTDGALFIASQGNSFPNILASKFAMANGGAFGQPLMSDNIGGFVTTTGVVVQPPRLYFNGTGPTELSATPTTIFGAPATNAGNLNNFGIPGAKSFHLVTPNYGSPAGLATFPLTANPYFVRMGSPAGTTVMADVATKAPTFFTLSEIGGNDVLGYALSGGYNPEVKHPVTGDVIIPASNAVYQSDNMVSPATYGANDITNTDVFAQTFNGIVAVLTANSAKGVVANLPYITSLPHFTTVPYDALDPTTNATLAAQVPLLNTVYGAINQIYAGAGEPERAIMFDATKGNPIVIYDEDATDLRAAIAATLGASPTFIPFVQSLGFTQAQATALAPLIAQLLGNQYGFARSATDKDLFVLPSSSVIGTVNTTYAEGLVVQSGGMLPAALAGQFSAEGVTLPLGDKWVLTPKEQMEIKIATDAYNVTIKAAAEAKGLAFVDFNAILSQAATSGLKFDNYNLTTGLVTGGLVGLDGIHLTGRGYALMANKMLEAIDTAYGSNFAEAKDGLAKADDYPINYSPFLQ